MRKTHLKNEPKNCPKFLVVKKRNIITQKINDITKKNNIKWIGSSNSIKLMLDYLKKQDNSVAAINYPEFQLHDRK